MKFTLKTLMYDDAPLLELEPENELERALLEHLQKKCAVFSTNYSGDGEIRLRGSIKQPRVSSP